jgi:D-sedoheptulose 7-phosphate isomerase
MIDFKQYLDRYVPLLTGSDVIKKLDRLALHLESYRAQGGRILIFGNGASASIASHAALDFTKQGKLEALCFSDAALITAYANDYGYENAYKEILTSYCRAGDIVFLISTSGESENIIKVSEKAKRLGLHTVSFTGRHVDNRLKRSTEVVFWVDSHAYNIVENIHAIWITALVDHLVGKAEYEVK